MVSNIFIHTWLCLLAKCLGSSFKLFYDSKKAESPEVDFLEDPNWNLFPPALWVRCFLLDLLSLWVDFFSWICFRNSSSLCLVCFDSFSYSRYLSCSGILTTSLVRLSSSVTLPRCFLAALLRLTSSSVYMTSLLSKYITFVSKFLSAGPS